MTGHLVLTAGGTGGHMFPALALAAELERRGAATIIVCDRRGARYLEPGRDHRIIAAASPSGSPLRRVAGMARLLVGLVQATIGLIVRRPRAVVAFGGYASVPVALAARLLHIPLMVHEQNAVLGRANRLIAARAALLALSYEATRGVRPREGRRDLVTGNPVRASVAEHADAPYQPPDPAGDLHVLVVGGSQGARVLSDAVPAAIAALEPALRARIVLTQQCRPEDLDRVRAAYDAIGFEATLAPFFTDLPERLARVHLAVSRSGASSVAELLVLGCPAILVPYRHAAEDHQRANAEALVEAGAAWMLSEEEITGERLAALLVRLLQTPELLRQAAERAQAMAPKGAAHVLADVALGLVESAPAGNRAGAPA